MSANIRVAGLLIAAVIVLIALIQAVSAARDAPPELQLGLVIVLAVFMLMVLLFIMTAGFVQFKLADPHQALGLPEGTIRALIALILIMLFVILGIYLFRTVGEGGVVPMRGLTQEQVVALGPRVVTSSPVAGTSTYNVTVQSGLSDDGNRLAQQLVTTIGTLVVAVAGFYFGTSATAAGASAATSAIPLVIRSTSPLPTATTGQQYSASLESGGGTGPYTWSLVSGTLPPDLQLDRASGQITGKVTAAGGPFTIQVEDQTKATAIKTFELPVTPAAGGAAGAPAQPAVAPAAGGAAGAPAQPLTIDTAATLPGATTNQAYTTTLQPSGGTPPYTWTVTAGAVPPDLQLNPSGVISGNPVGPGGRFTAQVEDATHATAAREFDLAIT